MGIFSFLKKQKSPYVVLKEKIESELIFSQFSNDWRRTQELNLKLLWLSIIKDSSAIMKQSLPEQLKFLVADEDINDKTIEMLNFPVELNHDDITHINFAERIFKEYAKSIGFPSKKFKLYENCMYKPASLLPYPKKYIGKVLGFSIGVFKGESKILGIPSNADEVVANIQILGVMLPNFLETEDELIPLVLYENIIFGQEFKKN